jgi:FKBP-type peptidyl-prolyl cis-trans isomerase FkpA
MKKLYILPGVLILLLASCYEKTRYPGYKLARHGIYYKLLKIGEDTKKPKPGDFVTVDLSYKTLDDSVFFTGRRKFQITRPSYKGAIDECFMMLAEKESATFIISAADFFNKTLQTGLPRFFNENSSMKVTIDVIEIQTEEQYQKEKEAFMRWIQDFGDYEKVILKQFLEEKELPVKPILPGIYYINLRKGTGKRIETGDTITINYEGKFLNGKFFDSTIKRNQPFQFVYGTEWQVIKGLEKALGFMHEGEKAIIILSSDLAFGKEGSSTGIIPPFTSLIFEVEILKVN